MSTERLLVRVAVFLVLQKGDEVLLLKRANTGHEDGNYGLVCGHLDPGETALGAMVREAREEAGITIAPDDLKLVQTQHLKDAHLKENYINLYFTASRWQGQVTNVEPEKCDGLEWFPMGALPRDTIAYVRSALNAIQTGAVYSDWGW